jgi:hypothetical protein
MPQDKERMKRGLNAIFDDSMVEEVKSEVGGMSQDYPSKMSDHPTVDKNLLRELIGEVANNGRVSFWSIQVALMMAYLGATRPARGFSVSNEIREILEPGLKDKYPELYEAIEAELADR